MINCNEDVGCRYELSTCLLEAYTDKVNLIIVMIKDMILVIIKDLEIMIIKDLTYRCDQSVSAIQCFGPYPPQMMCARGKS